MAFESFWPRIFLTDLRRSLSPVVLLTDCLLDQPPKKKRKSENAELYEVEKVVDYSDKSGSVLYCVRWTGYDLVTWEPIENLINCNYLLMKFFEKKPAKPHQIHAIKKKIDQSLRTCPEYLILVKSNFSRSALISFFGKCDLNYGNVFGERFRSYREFLNREYNMIVRCLIGMGQKQDRGMFLRGRNYRIALMICKMRQKQLKRLNCKKDQINALEACRVEVENNCDLQIISEDLVYVTENVVGTGVEVSDDPLVGCSCIRGCSVDSRCCAYMSDAPFAYTNGKLRLSKLFAIYECNRRCSCPITCPNRIVQRGRNVELVIFKTEDCGWGVKTLEPIKRGWFVCEYFGELITASEAEFRENDYSSRLGSSSYMFNLDFTVDGQYKYCVDATRYGNLARFINHSCDPNLTVYPVWVDCADRDLPRLAFFAKRDIQRNEELNLDYMNIDESVLDDTNQKVSPYYMERCKCKSSKCREWIFGDKNPAKYP